MAATMVHSPPASILFVHAPAGDSGTLIVSLHEQGLTVTPAVMTTDLAWPPGAIDSVLVRAESLEDPLRTAVQRLKRGRAHVPFVLWSAPGSAAPAESGEDGDGPAPIRSAIGPDRVEAVLAGGFDLWLPAEVSVVAVAAQVRSLCRLVSGAVRAQEPQVVAIRGVTIDLQRREVTVGERVVPLTPTEFRIIAHMAQQPGRVVSHNELFRDVHGYDASEQEAKDILKVHISRLRTKLSQAGMDEELIVTVRGFGYLLERRTPRGQAAEDGAES